MSVNDNVFSGYFVVSDDMVILPERIKDFDKTSIWMPNMIIANLTTGKRCLSKFDRLCSRKHWFWTNPTYNKNYRASYNEIQQLASKGRNPHVACHRNILNFSGAPNRIIFGYSDIYYIPAAKAVDFITITSIFSEHRAFLEVAVPTVLICIEGKKIMLKGISQANGNQRPLPWVNTGDLYNNRTLVFYHATKWKNVSKRNKQYRKFYKDTVKILHNCTAQLTTQRKRKRKGKFRSKQRYTFLLNISILTMKNIGYLAWISNKDRAIFLGLIKTETIKHSMQQYIPG